MEGDGTKYRAGESDDGNIFYLCRQCLTVLAVPIGLCPSCGLDNIADPK